MIRKIAILLSSLGTIGFGALTIQRLTFDYNENGIYFDGETTYDADAIVAFGVVTGFLLMLTVFLMIMLWKRKAGGIGI